MRVIIDSKERKSLALNLVQNIMEPDCPMEVTIEPYVEPHSHDQRKLFHALCRDWGNEAGYTMGQVKEAIKQHVYGTDSVVVGGRPVTVTGSTERTADGKLRDKTDYSELIEHAYRLAAEDGIVLS